MFKKQVLSLMAFTVVLSSSAFAQWTAIAYDPQTNKWGRAQCAPTYFDAEQTALGYCDGNCQIVAYSENGWASLAVGAGNHFGTGGLHDSQFDAEQDSLEHCQGITTGCHTLVDGFAFNCQ